MSFPTRSGTYSEVSYDAVHALRSYRFNTTVLSFTFRPIIRHHAESSQTGQILLYNTGNNSTGKGYKNESAFHSHLVRSASSEETGHEKIFSCLSKERSYGSRFNAQGATKTLGHRCFVSVFVRLGRSCWT